MEKRHEAYESGFTLIELLAVVLMLALIISAVPTSFRGSIQVWEKGDRHAEVLQNALIGMEHIVRELRQAEDLTGAGADYIEFDDRDGYYMRFDLGTGEPVYLQQESDSVSSSLSGPVNSLSFTYYDGDNNALSFPVSVDEVRSVMIQMVTEDSEGKVRDIPLSGRVYMRDFSNQSSYRRGPAIICNGDLNAAGEFLLLGDSGGIHVNGDLEISGNPQISRNATASGEYDEPGNPTIGGEWGDHYPVVYIPPVIPSDYLYLAEYILKAGGEVIQFGSSVGYPEYFRGWKFSDPRWEFASDEFFTGSYYIEGEAAVISSAPEGQVWDVTLICEGSIIISGNPNMRTYVSGLLLVTGADLEMGGESWQIYEGYMLVHEQLKLNGNATLNGAIRVEDAPNDSGIVSENLLDGNFELTYNGLLPPLSGRGRPRIDILSWRYEDYE